MDLKQGVFFFCIVALRNFNYCRLVLHCILFVCLPLSEASSELIMFSTCIAN